MITEAIAIAFITGGLAVVSNIIVAVVNNSKTIYRIDQLEKKVEKQSVGLQRIPVLEEKLSVANHRIGDLEKIVAGYKR